MPHSLSSRESGKVAELSMQFGNRLRQERLSRHLSQEALAEALGTSLKSISRWEKNQALPQAYYRLKLSQFFDIALNDLFEPQEEQEDQIPQEAPILQSVQAALPLYWGVPFMRNPCFTGRDTLLAALHTQIATRQPIALTQISALSGLGGIGKTQSAIEYAYRYAQEYKAVFWIRAETIEQIFASMSAIAELLQLPGWEDAEQQKIAANVKHWLATHTEWLLIWDNLEDTALLQRFLPPAHQGANLITTRCQALGMFVRRLDLPPMKQEEGTLFVLRRAKVLEPHTTNEHIWQFAARWPAEYAAALELVKVMGGLPLALDQAGAYVEETGCSFVDYLHLYKQRRAYLLERRGGPGEEHPCSVMTTFTLAKEQVERDHKAAGDLLCMCAFLYTEVIPEELFVVGSNSPSDQASLASMDTANQIPLVPAENASNQIPLHRFQFDQVIAALRRLSLVQRHPETRTFSLHRLVQVALQEGMNEQERGVWLTHTIATLNTIFPQEISITWQQCARLLPHVLSVAALIPDGAESSELAELLQKAADHLRERVEYKQAETIYQRVLCIWERTFGAGSIRAVPALAGLALLSYEHGKYAEGEALYMRALLIQEQAWGREHLQIAHSLLNIGRFSFVQGKYEQSEAFYLRALDILEKLLGSEHRKVATALNNLAVLYFEQGKYEQVEPLYQRALRIWRQTVGPQHSLVAYPLVNLADLYTEQGKYEEAELFYQQGLQIWEQALEMEHPVMAEGLSCQADLYVRQQRYAEAEVLYQRALRIVEQSWGLEHPEAAAPLNGLANVYQRQGKDEEALVLYGQALALRERHLNQHHPKTAQTLYDLATFHWKRGNSSEAMPFAQRALTIYSYSLGDTHPKTVAARMIINRMENAASRTPAR